MAAFLGGSSVFLARVPMPTPKPQQISCSQAPRPPPTPSNQPILSQSPNTSSPEPPPPSPPSPSPIPAKPQQKPTTAADSTDWIASSLTRRFGLGAGLAWVAFLAFGVVSEQIKTRFEASQQEANTKQVKKEVEVVLPNGIRYYDVTVGGGATPQRGDLVVIDLQGRVQGSEQAFVDTFEEGKRPLALVMGSRPYAMGMCEGVEYVLRSMKAGGKRRVVVPPSYGFGDEGAYLETWSTSVPPGATLEFVVQVDKVSIAPS